MARHPLLCALPNVHSFATCSFTFALAERHKVKDLSWSQAQHLDPQHIQHRLAQIYRKQACYLLHLFTTTVLLQAAAFLAFRVEHNTESFVIVFATSAVALSYNVVHSIMIQQTSAVTTTVIGQAKIIGLLVLSALLLGESSLRQPLHERCVTCLLRSSPVFSSFTSP